MIPLPTPPHKLSAHAALIPVPSAEHILLRTSGRTPGGRRPPRRARIARRLVRGPPRTDRRASADNIWFRDSRNRGRSMGIFLRIKAPVRMFVHGRPGRATVDLSCSCGSQRLQVPSPTCAAGALLHFRGISGRAIIAATRGPHSAVPGHCPEGDMTWLLAP